MCGIVGYVGSRPCRELLLDGLGRLEYRGYDSAGLSLLVDGEIDSVHAVGIVENWAELRERLSAEGAKFSSETDAEVVAHLIAHHLEGDLLEAVRQAYLELRGHYAFVAMSADAPGLLVGARKECPLVVGLGDGETFFASAIPAFLSETRRVQIVEDDEIVVIRPDGSPFYDIAGQPIEREAKEVDWDQDAAEKGGY